MSLESARLDLLIGDISPKQLLIGYSIEIAKDYKKELAKRGIFVSTSLRSYVLHRGLDANGYVQEPVSLKLLITCNWPFEIPETHPMFESIHLGERQLKILYKIRRSQYKKYKEQHVAEMRKLLQEALEVTKKLCI